MNHTNQSLEKEASIKIIRLIFLLVTVPMSFNFFLYDDDYSKYFFYFVKTVPEELNVFYTFGSILSVYVFYKIWCLFLGISKNKADRKYLSDFLKNLLLLFYLVTTIIFMVLFGKIGEAVESTPLIIVLNLIQPAFVLIVLLYCMSHKRGLLWWVSLISYIYFAAISGFMTYYIYLIPLLFSAFNVRLGFIKTLIIIFIFILFSGILRYWKFFLINIDDALEMDYVDFISIYWEWIALNFARVDFSLALYDVDANINHLGYIFSNKYVMPYNSGFVFSYMSKLLGLPTENLNQLWNELIFGDQGSHYFPIIAYLFLPSNIFLQVLIFSVIMILYGWNLIILIQRYLNDKDGRAYLFFGLMLVFILPQGWYWTFLNFLQGLSILALLLLIFSNLKSPRLFDKNLEYDESTG